jgi:hypothetical protein
VKRSAREGGDRSCGGEGKGQAGGSTRWPAREVNVGCDVRRLLPLAFLGVAVLMGSCSHLHTHRISAATRPGEARGGTTPTTPTSAPGGGRTTVASTTAPTSCERWELTAQGSRVAAGSITLYLQLENGSPQPCLVPASPRVELLGASGPLNVPIQVEAPESTAPLAIPGLGKVVFSLTYSDVGSGCASVTKVALLGLGSGTSVSDAAGPVLAQTSVGLQPCGTVKVSGFSPAGTSGQGPA